jgi:hypothetical protein
MRVQLEGLPELQQSLRWQELPVLFLSRRFGLRGGAQPRRRKALLVPMRTALAS